MGHEEIVRLGFFFGILSLMLICEVIFPMRKNNLISSYSRKFHNLGIVVFNTVTLRLVFPVVAVGVAQWCQNNNIGFLHYLDIPTWLVVLIGFLILDLFIYLQHVLFHYLPLLWKIHRVHHADMEYDVTTGLRFHPIEIILSMIIKFAVIIFIGAPVLSVIIFEIVLSSAAMFNHSNIKIPKIVDKILRLLFVTPDMHRVHHSIIPSETNTNFGFNFPWWDRLFGTYLAQPIEGHDKMIIGVNKFREPKNLHLHRMLIQPFIKDKK